LDERAGIFGRKRKFDQVTWRRKFDTRGLSLSDKSAQSRRGASDFPALTQFDQPALFHSFQHCARGITRQVGRAGQFILRDWNIDRLRGVLAAAAAFAFILDLMKTPVFRRLGIT
jgi:hypothetical protein